MTNPQSAIRNPQSAIGAVLVAGAGIGGMQASLDLAEAGFKVYLLDKKPAIGGVMAQLDKTFPTNDCAMCILSPKLVECGRHLNVEVLTYAELESVEGEPGNFTARVRQKPRYVVVDECTGCGDCATACPIIRPDQFNIGLSERRAAYKLYPQAIPNAYVIEKRGRAPCRDACPIHQRAQGYVALIQEGRYADAYRTIREENPFPSICGRVCNHKCEDACSRGQVDEPVNIMRLKHFVADWALAHPEECGGVGVWERSEVEPTGKRVAIVGAGPAGMTCAQDLALQGHGVTVFEALPVAGGMMRVGIPSYRMPYDLVQKEIDDILALGVELRLDHRVDDATALLGDGYDAVFVAVGAHRGTRLPIPGADLPQAISAIDFLREVALQEETSEVFRDFRSLAGKRVMVLGGGDVAMDAVCTALRVGTQQAQEEGGAGPQVHIVYRRSRAEAPAQIAELRQAEDEGVIFDYLTTPVEIIAGEDGNVCGMRCVRLELGEPDESGRRRPVPIEGSEFDVPADVVIFAIGARPDLNCLPEEVARGRGDTIVVDSETLATNVEGLFAGGDAVTGMAFVVDAIAAGHKAARSIDAYVRGDRLWKSSETSKVYVAELTEEEARAQVASGAVSETPRHEVRQQPVAERVRDFREVYTAFTEEEARAEAARCLSCGICSECLQCVYACQKHCIDHDMREEILELNVGAVVLVPGAEAMPGDIRPELGYGRLPNVVTSIEFERMLSASGPWGGVVQRPSDGQVPHKVAFIQCVGSRDISCDHGYCSTVCCMYATKEAVIAREHDPNVEPTIFYMDVRSFGKGFESYIERAEAEYGVRYVRSQVAAVTEAPGTGRMRLKYATPDGQSVEEEFDLVVLSVGLQPPEGTRELAERLGVELNEYGFAEMPSFRPAQTTRPGIFVAGAFSEPKDIPETVVEASCAAAQASALLAEARDTLTEKRVWPEERDVSRSVPRIGVFICHCGINIGAVVDVPDVVEYARDLPYVAYAEENLYTCSQDTQEQIRARIEEHDLNRVVVASCTPRTHEPLFQETLRGAGLNPHLFEMANIREQDSWVHRDNHGKATDKAKELVAMAVAKARELRAIPRRTFEIDHRALVIGGGLAGMTAALSIAEQGFGVTLVEREEELGGNLRHIYTALPNDQLTMTNDQYADPQVLLEQTIEAVSAHPRISVLAGAEVVEVGGYLGQYRTTVRLADGQREEVQHGVAVVATGARQIEPVEYLYGEDPRVITQRELEEILVHWETGKLGNWEAEPQSTNLPIYQSTNLPTSVVMIQCVGSRDEEHPYCSRICCTEAIKNALAIKERSPGTEVYILYRDIRTFGFKERYYREARRKGVVFLQYDKDQKPEVKTISPSSHLQVDVTVQPEGEVFTLDADLVVLSAGIEPNVDNDGLAKLLKVPLDEDGFFLEAHVKLRPLDFAADGVYLCGMAHSPRFLEETIAQARGAAVRAVTLLSKEELEATPIVASVNPLLCSNCGQCIEVCPYDARVFVPPPSPPLPLPLQGGDMGGYVQVIDVLCQGCGACVTVCPNKASQQKGFEVQQVYGMLDAVMMAR
ncbi:MAG: FAD-dependent oxidoreductase [Anaerolineae bacterium]|nr:FAD-dependent oxidoreductase [Anaerolineae bacterium]